MFETVMSATEIFWRPHLREQKEVVIVVNQPLFFRDRARRMVFRCFGVDSRRNTTPADVLRSTCPDEFREGLEVVQPYLLSGEVSARDAIAAFFSKSARPSPTTAISGRMPDDAITRTSLILLGDSGLNRFIDSLEAGTVGSMVTPNIGWLEREDYLPYRLLKRSAASPNGVVRIYEPTDEEIKLFPAGTFQEISGSRNDRVTMYSLRNDPSRFVYSVVTRMPNPYNQSAVTIISSLFSEAVEQVARLLTEDSIIRKFTAGLPWQSGSLPSAFQGLFAVSMGIPQLDAGALSPQFVCWRDLTPTMEATFDEICKPIKIEESGFNSVCTRRSTDIFVSNVPGEIRDPDVTVYLCHAAEDKPAARELFRRLKESSINVWFDEESLLPGRDRQIEIHKAIRSSQFVIILLSTRSVTTAGYLQKEIRAVVDVAEELPEGKTYIIPLKLDECETPNSLSRWHWGNLNAPNGYKDLIRVLARSLTSNRQA